MKHGRTLLVGFSLLALAGAPAYANEPAGKQAEGKYETSGQMAVTASGLIGKQVVDMSGQEIGEIKDVVINLSGGKVHAAVLEFGGVLGMGEKHYAFPVRQLQAGKNKDRLVLNVDKEKLKDAQGFAKGQWPAMNDEYWGRVGGPAAAAGGTKAQARDHKLVRASDMIGKNIQGKNGNEVGEIKDLTLRLKDGSVSNVIVDLNEGGRAMLQTSAFTTGTDGKLLLTMSAEQLKSRAQKN